MSEPIDKHIPPAEAATTAEPVAPVAVPEASAEQPAPHENPTPTTTAAAPEPAAVTNTAAPEPVAKIQVVDGPEPSSPLYDKLTEADKAAVKSLRTKLPEIFAEVNKDKPPTSVSIWGVDLAPGSPPTAKEAIVLYKFLKARNMVLADAQTMLLATLKWRQEFDIDAVRAESFPEDVFGKLGVVAGKDKDGRPVTYNLYSEAKGPKNAEVFGDVKRFIRWRVQLMERGIELLDFETIGDMVQVHDYSGLGSGDRTPESKVAASEAAATFTAHYPELLSRKFFCGVPTYLTWIFWFFKTIIPAQTFAKMQVVGTGKETIGKELRTVIDQSQLPVKYGGDLKTLE